MCSEASLACLQDRIVQMQETHFSTTEELQATLAELTDLQDIVDQLYNDNQQLHEDKKVHYCDFFKRQSTDRVVVCSGAQRAA